MSGRGVLPLVALLAVTTTASSALSLDAAVRKGIAHFQTECAAQQALLPELLAGLKAKDLSRSIAAYTAARPPYEQIETLAIAFEQEDADIDARPNVFEFGEDSPEFRGFHVIERALYRDQRLDGMYEVGLTLNSSVNDLCMALKDMSRFNPRVSFEGSVALAFEVPAKKVTSEEETWSDLSLMIFRNNYRGIWSQVSPFFRTSAVSNMTAARLKKRYAEVRRAYAAIDPDHPFFTREGESRPYSSVTFPERRTLIDTGYQFVKALEAVRDEVFAVLPPAEDGHGEEEEEHSDMQADMFKNETRKGLERYLAQCRRQKTLADELMAALRTGDLEASKLAYSAARPPYEQIEVLAADFPGLDANIDQRPPTLARAELDDDWRGFHLVERKIFREADIDGAISGLSVLSGDISDLCDTLQDGVNGGGSFTAMRHFEGMIVLSYEVPAKKISSEEEEWSDLSIMIFRENVKGIWSLFEPFKGVLPRESFDRVDAAYLEIKNYIQYVVDFNNDFESGTSFIKYSQVPIWQRKGISELFYELGRSLIAAKESLFPSS